MSDPRSPLSPQDFRNALGGFASGVTVVTTRDAAGIPHGVTVSAFSSLSLSPPQVLFCLDKRNSSLDAFLTGAVAIHILRSDQAALSNRFAGPAEDRFAGLAVGDGPAPMLPGCACVIAGDVQSVVDSGDHYIVILAVQSADVDSSAEPLLYYRGQYGTLAFLEK